MEIKCFFDGACSNNPDGAMGIGGVIIIGNKTHEISKGFEAKKGNSNNVAEYLALKAVLEHLSEIVTPEDKVIIQGDSALVVKQMAGLWKIKKGEYVQHAKECKTLINSLKSMCNIGIGWIPRERNEYADQLSNDGVNSVSKDDVVHFL